MNMANLIPPAASPRPISRGQSRAPGGQSRAGGNRGGAIGLTQEEQNKEYKGRFSSINTAKSKIEEQRRMDEAKEKLKSEFAEVDEDADGNIKLDELQRFLERKNGGQFDESITAEIYNMIDLNHDGKVTLEEFVTKYLDTRQKLNERLNEVYKKICDHNRQRNEMEQKLEAVKRTEKRNQFGIMIGSILTVHVVEARELKSKNVDGISDPYVSLSIEDQIIESNFKKATLEPVWNESFTFEIQHGQNMLFIKVLDKDTFGEDNLFGLAFLQLGDIADQMKHDMMLDLVEPKQGQMKHDQLLNKLETMQQQNRHDEMLDWMEENLVRCQGKIRVMVQWVYSKEKYFDNYLAKWDQTLYEDVKEKEAIDGFVLSLESPFGFLAQVQQEVLETEEDGEEGEPKSQFEQVMKANDQKMHKQEVEMARTVDAVSNNIAKSMGFSHVPWFTLTKVLLGIQTALTCAVLSFRPDFINLTVCTIGIYMLLNTEHIKRWTFRVLVFGIALSLVIDLVWFLFIQDYSQEHPEDGGIEKGIRSFSLTMSYLSFFFRIIVAIVFWKDSLDFSRIIKRQMDKVEPMAPPGQSPEQRKDKLKKQAEDIAQQVKGRQMQEIQLYNQQQQFQNQRQAPPSYQNQQFLSPSFDQGRR